MRRGGPRNNPRFSVRGFDPKRKHAGYLLFLGRLSQVKGVDLAIQIARASGLPLVVAGQAESGPGVPEWLGGLAAKAGNGVRWVGPVDHAGRRPYAGPLC